VTQLDLFTQQRESVSTARFEQRLPMLLAFIVELESVAEHVLIREYMGQPERAVAIEKQRVARDLRQILAEDR